MAVINIDDAYILNETGAQVDKVTGLYFKDESTSAAEKAFAQLNIGTAGSNRNLLDNPWFTVRQRGDGPFTSGYTADRWVTQSTGASISFGDNGATITLGSASYAVLTETFDLGLAQALAGETVTASVKMADGTIFSWQMVMLASGMDANLYFTYNGKTVRINCYTTASAFLFRMPLYGDMTIRAVKLELGSVSTLANDAPPDYGTELTKCQRYFVRLKSAATQDVAATLAIALAGSTTAARAVVNLPTTLNAKTVASYSLSYSGTINLVEANNSTSHVVSNVILGEVNENSVFLRLDTTGLTVGSNYFVRVSSGAYIDISAD